MTQQVLPGFLHIGVAKAASSWLFNMCKEHPDVYVPHTPDNVNFFTVHYHRGLDWYRETYFADYAGQKASIEFSNSYLVWEPALERIARDLPDVKLTLTLRNPVERAFLNWAHQHLKPTRKYDPANGIGIPLDFVLHHHGHQWFGIWCGQGYYAYLLKRLYRHFSPDRVLVMIYDDLVANDQAFLNRFFEFMGVDPSITPSRIAEDINKPPPTADPARWMTPDFRAELRKVFEDDIAELEKMLGRDFSHWR